MPPSSLKKRPGSAWRALALVAALASSTLTVIALQSRGYGPEVKSFLSFIKQEEDELTFQIKNNEISRREYLRSKTRLDILKQSVLDRVRRTHEDLVPEFHVVIASEIDSLVPDGTALMKNIKPGGNMGSKWRYVGKVIRGETFYIVERIPDN